MINLKLITIINQINNISTLQNRKDRVLDLVLQDKSCSCIKEMYLLLQCQIKLLFLLYLFKRKCSNPLIV
jgi:hypothetical protein